MLDGVNPQRQIFHRFAANERHVGDFDRRPRVHLRDHFVHHHAGLPDVAAFARDPGLTDRVLPDERAGQRRVQVDRAAGKRFEKRRPQDQHPTCANHQIRLRRQHGLGQPVIKILTRTARLFDCSKRVHRRSATVLLRANKRVGVGPVTHHEDDFRGQLSARDRVVNRLKIGPLPSCEHDQPCGFCLWHRRFPRPILGAGSVRQPQF